MTRTSPSLYIPLLPLVTGIILYWLFRGIPITHLAPVISLKNRHNILVNFILYSVPDGLWLYALLESLRCVWRANIFRNGSTWVFLVSIGAIASEFAQYFHVIPGTFDILDIAAYLLAITVFTVQYLNFIKQPNPITI